jgi:hypothetical protein
LVDQRSAAHAVAIRIASTTGNGPATSENLRGIARRFYGASVGSIKHFGVLNANFYPDLTQIQP